MRNVALAFVAHPDDAEMACTGTMIQLGQRGWELHIATLTGGGLGSVTERPDDAVTTRKAEAARAAELIGARYHCLDEPDGRAVYSRDALDKAYELFREISPGLVFAHPPIDYHRDHEVSHQIARAASFVYAAPHAGRTPLAEDAGVPYLYYIWVKLDGEALGRQAEPTTVIDVAEQMETRKHMLSFHQSQVEWIRHHHGGDIAEGLINRSREVGHHFGLDYGEAFIQHRVRPYPKDDVLEQQLGNAV